MTPMETDVVIVGASIAGCAAATLLARAGMSVTVLDSATELDHYKKLCTHYVQSSAIGTLERLGLVDMLRTKGALPNRLNIHTPWGWIEDAEEGHGEARRRGFNVRRSVLDPALRRLAAGEQRVQMRLGTKVTAVLRDGARVIGVEAVDSEGEARQIKARLVIGADGRKSTVARLTELPVLSSPNHRFGYFAHFTGLETHGGVSRSWLRDPVCINQFPNDGITVVSCLLPKSHMETFRQDVDANFRALFEGLPDGPDLSRAQRVSAYFGVYDFPNIYRPDAPPGLALIGDAAMASDPLAGVGCGWALQSAEWLADAVAAPLREGGDLDTAVRRFRALHKRRLKWHRFTIAEFSLAREFTAVERFFLKAAAGDQQVAARLHGFLSREEPVSVMLSPGMLGRSVRQHLRQAFRRKEERA